ncbi:MAG: 50S ribosomal protein L23 [Rickettsiales bacterium]
MSAKKEDDKKPAKKVAAKKADTKAAPKKAEKAAEKPAKAEAKTAPKKEAVKEAPKKAEKADEKPAKKEAKPAAKKSSGKLLADVTLYSVIERPVITEKSTMALEHNKVVFRVAKDASKDRIKQAVEGLFGVTVTAVNTINIKGKSKRFRGFEGKRQDVRKAIVTLKQGDTIDLAAGV